MLCSYVLLGFSLITTSITQHEAHAFSTRMAKEINPVEAQPLMYGLPSVKYLRKRSAPDEDIGAYKASVDSLPLADPIQDGAYKADVDSSPEENIGAYKASVDSLPLADPIQDGAYKADVDSSPEENIGAYKASVDSLPLADPIQDGAYKADVDSSPLADPIQVGAYKADVDSSPLADPIQVGAYKADVDSSPVVDLIQDESIGSPSETTQLAPRRRRRKKSQMCPKKYSCADCSTVRICGNRANGSLVETKVKCQSETPFCNERTGTCDSEPGRLDLCGDMINSTFVCQTDGFYPNPETTNKFYLCFQGYAFSLSCNKNQRFNLDKNLCTNNQITLFYDEIVFDCQKLHGVKVKHTQYDRYYAFCIDGVPSMVDKCGVNYRFDFDSQSCLPSNHDTSLLVYIPDVRDCSKYYTKFWNQDVITPRMCAPGFYFDYFMASCVPDSSVCLDKNKYNI
ncbi:uncharacterized protein LOC111063634 isoform X4 [Nilaparvata lugens]|uniref:uncharacterized protein LOC111063634 isoform X3 n=1 Tax=Nilaparvata lugens TaxID=108931 RepID=UPI00193E434B|nr:uncharacterized protein LOC111063634 isoform X3 [Nilaparvata lugens]XP_039290090.1 uncharacterized protein LOC111063634 isoform X4 [Nilaparvata lugens]